MARKSFAVLYVECLKYIRAHPDAGDDQVAEALGIYRFEREQTIAPARRTVDGEAGRT